MMRPSTASASRNTRAMMAIALGMWMNAVICQVVPEQAARIEHLRMVIHKDGAVFRGDLYANAG